ncbi:uncharacterized protein A4U43_C05F35320 [Asparagus officinalis]|uniref:PHD-type domain-containing protein n=1 Tax=Asparagus officinalis TaxID=4686 RepID=A0A5P1EXF7_ASPOF|nr:uncharacterized protein LOC109841375 [Asparagus officinalis]ONK70592.1 uncharacterized protein A4U43_C05F35320 [Asparagus officinalis]
MTPNYDEYAWDRHRKGKESKSIDADLLGFSEGCSDLSNTSNVSAEASPKTNGSAYKRRKLHGNSVALLSEEITKDTTPTELSSCSYKLRSRRKCLTENKHNLCVAPANINGRSIDPLAKVCVEASNGKCSSSEGNVECSLSSANIKREVNDEGDSSITIKESLGEFSSAKDLCIFVLKRYGLLPEGWKPRAWPFEVTCSDNVSPSQPCKICGHLEDPLKMLICDGCEEAFHLSCCNPKVRELPCDKWYCQPCFRKKPKPLLQAFTEMPFNITSGKYGCRGRPYKDLILDMLKDTHPYATDVRIGRNFQVELPDWLGTNSIDNEYFGKPSEMDPTKFTDMSGWICRKAKSFGNWIQCKEVVDTEENGRKNICGKWRRAPLFIEQTEDWDCSCAVTWDPIHADCAVPQELATSEVLKQLKFVEKVNARLAAGKLQKVNEKWPRSS